MEQKLPKTVDELECSQWGQIASDASKKTEIINKTQDLLKGLGKNKAIARRAGQALELYKTGMDGGKKFLTPRNVIILGAALAYFISPLDCIPDFLPVVGWLDDVGILAMASAFIFGKGLQKSEKKSVYEVTENSVESLPDEVVDSLSLSVAPGVSAPSLSQELDQLEEEANALGASDLAAEIAAVRMDAADSLKRVVFTGSFNTGKSSLINALLEKPFLPVKAIPCTPILTNLLYADSAMAVLDRKDGSQEVLTDLSLIEDTESDLMKGSREMTLMLPAELLKGGLTFIDTCGLQDSVHDMIPYEQMPHSAAFVFVKSADVGSLNKDEYQFFRKVAEHIPSSQIIVVLNKVDLVGEESAGQIKQDLQREFASMGLGHVSIFCVSALPSAADHFELAAFRDEIVRRATNSLPGLLEQAREKSVQGLKGRLHAAAEAKKEVDAMEADMREKYILAVQDKAKLRIGRIKAKADLLLENFNNALRAYVNGECIPGAHKLADTLPMDEHYASEIMAFIRNSLSDYLRNNIEFVAKQLEVEPLATEVAAVTTPPGSVTPKSPEVNENLVNTLAEFVLPGIAIAAFFPMGIFAWLTTIAAPTFVMDKLGVSKGIAHLIKNFGPGRKARDEFKRELDAQVDNAVLQIEQRMAQLVNTLVDKRSRIEMKSLMNNNN